MRTEFFGFHNKFHSFSLSLALFNGKEEYCPHYYEKKAKHNIIQAQYCSYYNNNTAAVVVFSLTRCLFHLSVFGFPHSPRRTHWSIFHIIENITSTLFFSSISIQFWTIARQQQLTIWRRLSGEEIYWRRKVKIVEEKAATSSVWKS